MRSETIGAYRVILLSGVLAALALPVVLHAQAGFITTEPAQLRGDTPATSQGWAVTPLFTVGETIAAYTPPGILDGLGALRVGDGMRVFINHELSAEEGYGYALDNGTGLTGARISFVDIDPGTRQIVAVGLAYHTIIDRAGTVVTEARQLHEGKVAGDAQTDGLDRFCSGALFEQGTFNLEDDVFFAGEEVFGGIEYALDVQHGVLYAVPWLGRAAWENITLLDTGDASTIAILGGDDRTAAPLLLYVGQKNALGDGSFLDRNGLAQGTLYAWVAGNGDRDPQDFNGTGQHRDGAFVEIDHYDAALAGTAGYDALGFATQARQDALAEAAGAFRFSRPEDVSTNPALGTQAVLASTGRGGTFPADNWGTTYQVDVDFQTMTALVTILYDGDDAGGGQVAHPDRGLRNPDNLDWADNGRIYIQEDRATAERVPKNTAGCAAASNPDRCRALAFGGDSGIEASLWELNPDDGTVARIATVDRSAVPAGQTDSDPLDLGDWETSGVLDVSGLFELEEGRTLLLAAVQAHSLRGDALAREDLVQGGQLVLIEGPPGTSTSAESAPGVPEAFVLAASYPNPFAERTTIAYRLPAREHVVLSVYDLHGRLVARLVDQRQDAGWHTVAFDAAGWAGGVYVYRIQAGRLIETGSMVLRR